jgi:hypothetical protein
MEEEKFKCEKCEKEFNSKEALEMHNKSKHSAPETKSSKINYRKIRNYGISIIVIGLIIWGVFMLMQSSAIRGEDFSRKIPTLGASHVPIGSISFNEYNSNPPTSGKHYDTPTRPGFRENIIEDGHLIHSMEHGLIWISYHPKIGEESEKLRDITGPFTVITQREANDEDIAVAAWGRLDAFNLEDETIDADDLQRINDFVKRYANKGPESIPVGQHGGI